MTNIYYFAVGFTHNSYVGVDGGCLIRNPLFIELIKHGHKVHWLGMNYLSNFDNAYLKHFGIDKQENLFDTSQYLNMSNNTNNIESDSVLIVEMRPNLEKLGYNFQKEWSVEFAHVKKFLDANVKVFVWEQDLWYDYIPLEFRDQIIMLKPYKKFIPGFSHQRVFHYAWSNCFSFQSFSKKLFDIAYIGNEYGRREKFLHFMKNLDGKKNVVVAGNWLREQTRDFALNEFPHFMWIGLTEMWANIPLLRLANATVHFARPEYEESGLVSPRIFDAYMAGIPCFTNKNISCIQEFVPEELLIDNSEDLLCKLNTLDLQSAFEKFAYKLKDKNVENQVTQLESWF